MRRFSFNQGEQKPMHLHYRHTWNLTYAEAIVLQQELAREVISNQPLDLDSIRWVAGVDVSVKENISQAAVVVLSFPALHIVETVTASQPTPFAYIPGLLSFREGPVLETAFAKLQHTPDVFLFDGMGIMHPRRIGIASHMGLWLQKPTVGCGKTHFIGTYIEPDATAGSTSPVIDKGDLIGAVVRTRSNVKPVYISPGHLTDLPTAIALTLRCTTRYRLPEPVRMAHQAAGKMS
jgi:deoxyribonuclease V